MGDRTSVTLQVLLVHAADVENILLEVNDSSEHNFKDERFHYYNFYEVNYGDLDFLPLLVEAGIAYNSQWDSGSEYGPGCEYCRFTSDGNVILKSISDSYINPCLDTLMGKLDDYAALKAFIIEHHNEVSVPSWEDQEEYGKIYKVKQLIDPT